MTQIEHIIEGCKKRNRKAQKELYDMFAPAMLGVCMRFTCNYQEAEDMMQEGFLKVLLHIDEYSGKGAFVAWMRKIMVNTAITHYNKNLRHHHAYDITEVKESRISDNDAPEPEFTQEELLNVVAELSPGYRMIFNLYAVEGYKHKEIAEMLNIDINTSKSQYSRARKIIMDRLQELGTLKTDYITLKQA